MMTGTTVSVLGVCGAKGLFVPVFFHELECEKKRGHCNFLRYIQCLWTTNIVLIHLISRLEVRETNKKSLTSEEEDKNSFENHAVQMSI